ncbi:Enolase-phosphatase E1 [Quaeritorhiza haematococci]|nr:Enolase-phosphatase E1 [Quaeritorhiza haematococci]
MTQPASSEPKKQSTTAAPQKRKRENNEPTKHPYTTVVLDIEGTTTPISFVHDLLFPYITTHLDTFLKQHWGQPELMKHVGALRVQSLKDQEEGKLDGVVVVKGKSGEEATDEETRESVAKNVRWQMGMDRKIGALKAFQGYMWRSAYEAGEIKGSVFEDVVPALERWTKELGCDVYIYSSGSIPAQKLLFGYSDKGDMLKYFKGHFDTGIGLKVESESYTRIAKEIERDHQNILFLSDNVRELEAATKAGFQVACAFRPGNAALSNVRTTRKRRIKESEEVEKKEEKKEGEAEKNEGEDAEKGEEYQETELDCGTIVPVVKTFDEVFVREEFVPMKKE